MHKNSVVLLYATGMKFKLIEDEIGASVVGIDGFVHPLNAIVHVETQAPYECTSKMLRSMLREEVHAFSDGVTVNVVVRDAKQFVVHTIDISTEVEAAATEFTNYVSIVTDNIEAVKKFVVGDSSTMHVERESYLERRRKVEIAIKLVDEEADANTSLLNATTRLQEKFLHFLHSIPITDIKMLVDIAGTVYADSSKHEESQFEIDVVIIKHRELDRLRDSERKLKRIETLIRDIV